ncbi:MAG: lysylphosphatidylglycerol synthase transmembrane domain-containing protein [Planctomycetota bacterium]
MTLQKGGLRRYLFPVVRLAVVAGGIAWAVHWINTQQAWTRLGEIFSRINPLVFAATLAIFTTGHIIIGLRWWLLLRPQSISIPPWAAIKLYFLGWFYNNFMPSSVGGDLVRAWYVTHHTDKKFEAVLSVFVDRAIGLLSTLVIAAFFYTLFLRGKGEVIAPADRTKPGLLNTLFAYRFLFVGLLVIAAAILAGLTFHPKTSAPLKKAWSSLWAFALKMLAKFKDAIIIYCREPLTILGVFCLTVLMQLTSITGFWLLGRNLGIEASVKYYYVFFTLVWVLGTIPVSIGGAVVMEGTLAYLFVRFAGVEPEAALALALCQRVVWMITSLPGAFIHLIGAHLPKDLSLDLQPPPG